MDGFYVHGKPPYENFKLHVVPNGGEVELTVRGARRKLIFAVVLPQKAKSDVFSEIKSSLRTKRTRSSLALPSV
jgi:hypothetical protein